MVFANRVDAGIKLSEKLIGYKGDNLIVLALPRGGVPLGYEIARVLDAPLDVLTVRKLGSPINSEFGIGAIAPEGIEVLDENTINYLNLSRNQIKEIENKERRELERQELIYRGNNPLPTITYKTVILVDDGLATGVSAKAAVKWVLSKDPNKLIVTIPVCAFDSVNELRKIIRSEDEVICLEEPQDFEAVGEWYQNFLPVTDEEVKFLLSQPTKKYWSHKVTKESNALDLEKEVFTWKDPKRIAKSLKKSAEASNRRKSRPFQSAMSILNFYINRAGKNLDQNQKQILEAAKNELRKLYKKNF